MRADLYGKRYLIKIVPRREFSEPGVLIDGLCDSPETKNKTLYVASELKGQRLLDITIHEALHACAWKASEEWVTGTARDIARLLWRLGWRKT